MKQEFKGFLTTKEEFLYPDIACEKLPNKIRLFTAKNGKASLQLLIKTGGKYAKLFFEDDILNKELFCMKKIPVEYNTGDGQEQGGAMVILSEQKPNYATRKAPFFVYDCLKPVKNNIFEAQDGNIAIYMCFFINENEEKNEHNFKINVNIDEGLYTCDVNLKIYNVKIPKQSFNITNWYSLKSIEKMHNVKRGSEKFNEILQKYVYAMKRTRQNTFFVQIGEECIKNKENWEFDFEYLKDEISLFFKNDMKTLEIGSFLSRGFLQNGKPDMYTDTFKCALAPNIPIETKQGYEITVKMLKSLKEFLDKYDFTKNLIIHVHDEPDVHYKDEKCLKERRRQYYMTVGIIKKYFPNCKIIEAVKTTEFRGCIDIWVPVTNEYEQNKQEFDNFALLGEEIWTYVCCVPEGDWLNRFLDKPVLEQRILMWGCEKNKLSGYLHWGFNMFQNGINPFKATSCPNNTGIGTNFPCGDAFIVYPDCEKNDVFISMRLEAQRRGVEDLELLRLLLKKDKKKYESLIQKVFKSNCDFEKSPQVFERTYEQLLKELEQY